MDRILIKGGTPLKGSISISGSKNAALPLMAASLLTEQTLVLKNLPHLIDIASMSNLLFHLGVEQSFDGAIEGQGFDGRIIELTAKNIKGIEAPYDLVRKMRASVLVLGPLLARFGQAKVSLPGGCAIGTRPIDLHIMGFEKLGAKIELHDGYVLATAENGLKGAEIVFPVVSVGATENLLMAASLAKGTTILENAACEPEVTDLANCLVAMGAKITGIGTEKLVIEGQESLHGAVHSIISDRIEMGTYVIAAAITNGEILLKNADLSMIKSVVQHLEKAGVTVEERNNGVLVKRTNGVIHGIDLRTEPFPGFPTDLQAQMMTLMCISDGASLITETIFENRFMHVPELLRMGADITLQGHSAMVRGKAELVGAQVMATDLRASVSLILAGLVAKGETIVNRVYHLDRGYERLEEKLSACGADIKRIK